MIGTLIVDDEPLTARAHAEYVSRASGFEVVATALNLQEAARALRSGGVDLVLLDMNLPDGHGLDLLRSVRAAGVHADVIAVTSAREVDTVREAVALGVVGYLIKPFSAEALRERLAAYREFRAGLSSVESVDQSSLDRMLRDLRSRPTSVRPLPKGLSPETLDHVAAALAQHHPSSAAEIGALIGSSRVTARRYLEHLVASGRAVRNTRLGHTGRPEVEYGPASDS